MILHLLAVAALLLYASSSLMLLLGTSLHKEKLKWYGTRLWQGGFLVLTLFVIATLFQERVFSTAGDYFLWIAWVVEATYTCLKINFPIVRLFVSTVILVIFASSSYLAHRAIEPGPTGGVLLFSLHVIPALLAEAGILLASIVSGVYLLQQGRLKRKSAESFLEKAPSLSKLQEVHRKIVVSGFFLMTLAIITGSLQAVAQRSPFLTSDTTRWSALLAWVLLAVLAHAQINLKWSFRRISAITTGGGTLFFVVYITAILITDTMLHEVLK